jgi:hypothetical protein
VVTGFTGELETMNVQPLCVTREQASAALREYKEHRNIYDQRDWEIERIYRAISKGKVVISVQNGIRAAGLDDLGRPRLAICEAHALRCACQTHDSTEVVFAIANEAGRFQRQGRIRIPWTNRAKTPWQNCAAQLPRIPPQFRPAAATLSSYHLLWEADWTELPRDPMLLKRIGKDAWVVLAAWDLTDVEMSVLRAHQGGRS